MNQGGNGPKCKSRNLRLYESADTNTFGTHKHTHTQPQHLIAVMSACCPVRCIILFENTSCLLTSQMALAILNVLRYRVQLLWVQVQARCHEKKQVTHGGGHEVELQLGPLHVLISQVSCLRCFLCCIMLLPATAQTPKLCRHKLHGLVLGHVAVNCVKKSNRDSAKRESRDHM